MPRTTTAPPPAKLAAGEHDPGVAKLYAALAALDVLPAEAGRLAIIADRYPAIRLAPARDVALNAWQADLIAAVESGAAVPDLDRVAVAVAVDELLPSARNTVNQAHKTALAKVGKALVDAEPEWSPILAARWMAANDRLVAACEGLPTDAKTIAADEAHAARWRDALAARTELAALEQARHTLAAVARERKAGAAWALWQRPDELPVLAGRNFPQRVPGTNTDPARLAGFAALVPLARPRWLSVAEYAELPESGAGAPKVDRDPFAEPATAGAWA
jgi:hypothetical protein